MTDLAQKTESNRDRVRRLLLTPLTDMGFKRPHRLPAAKFEDGLQRLVDDLGYMADDGLQVLFEMLKSKGAGKDRSEWPSRATILALAELVQPRPVEEMKNLVSWFRSREGARAIMEGVLVEEFEFFEQKKRPPMNEGERRTIRDKACAHERLRVLRREGRRLDSEGEATLARLARNQQRVEAIMAQAGAA